MNRSLWIPAAGCVLAFAALYAALNSAQGREGELDYAACASPSADGITTVPVNEAEQLLGSLRDTYVARWQAWENSPHRLLSRAMPRTLGPTSVELVMSPPATDASDDFVLGAMAIQRRGQTTLLPCVVEPKTKRVQLFHEGRWITADDWLLTAPILPKAKAQ